MFVLYWEKKSIKPRVDIKYLMQQMTQESFYEMLKFHFAHRAEDLLRTSGVQDRAFLVLSGVLLIVYTESVWRFVLASPPMILACENTPSQTKDKKCFVLGTLHPLTLSHPLGNWKEEHFIPLCQTGTTRSHTKGSLHCCQPFPQPLPPILAAASN